MQQDVSGKSDNAMVTWLNAQSRVGEFCENRSIIYEKRMILNS